MSNNLIKLLSLFLSFCLIFEQSAFAQSIDLSHYFVRDSSQAIPRSDKFRPLHLRYLGYDSLNNDFKLLLDKGDTKKEDLENKAYLEENTQTLLKYFFIGLALPNDKFWVNLRPDSPDNILDPELEKTDIGRIFLEADLQLKKDTAGMTSPQTPEGKAYWDKLYKKAEELFGTENITIPTITRPWIVPNEIIIREAPDNAYIYKATLKVMLEEDYLKSPSHKATRSPDSLEDYSFKDPRLKELNQYSTQLIKETIIPKLTYEVNTSKRYAQLRQVYYSLILAQWFKQKYSMVTRSQSHQSAEENPYVKLIDSGSLTSNFQPLTSQNPYSKETYFQQYQKSFKDGEYNLQEPVYTPMGQSIRRYMSGGMGFEKVLSVSSAISVNGGENNMGIFTKRGNIFVPPEVKILTPKQNWGGPIVFSNRDEIEKFSPFEVKKEIIIDGIDKWILQDARDWVAQNGSAFSFEGVDIKKLICRFIREAGVFLENDFSKFENWVEGRRKAVSTKKIITQAIERIEYLLYPDSKLQQTINNNRIIELIKFLSFAYFETGALSRRSIDLLISRLERNASGNEREEIKDILSRAELSLFAKEDILRIKKIIIETRERPKEFFLDYEKAINLFIEDDNNRREKLRPKLENLSALSDKEWEALIAETSLIGSQVLYDPESISNLSDRYPKRFGVEVELEYTSGQENEGFFTEIRLPEAGGFENTASDWKKMLKSLSKIETYRIKDVGIHIHIDRSFLDNESKRRVIVRIAKTLEAFWYRLGTEDVSKLDKVKPVSFKDFFEGAAQRKKVLINFSYDKNTVEFRFFGAPYLLNKKRFDVAMLQAQIELAMQIVAIASFSPESFTLIETGLPRLLGMDNSLITPNYVRIAIDKIYNGNPEGKINFIRLFFDKSVGRDWRREEGARWMLDDNEVRRHYEEAGLSWLYRLHQESFGWNIDMYTRIENICDSIKRNPSLLNEEYKGTGQLFIWMMLRGENEKERKLGRAGATTVYNIDSKLLADLISADSERELLVMIALSLKDDSLAESLKKELAVLLLDCFHAGIIKPNDDKNLLILFEVLNEVRSLLDADTVLDIIKLYVSKYSYSDGVKTTLLKIISKMSPDKIEYIVSKLFPYHKDSAVGSGKIIEILLPIISLLSGSEKKGEYLSEIISNFDFTISSLDNIFKIMSGLKPAEKEEKARLLLSRIESFLDLRMSISGELVEAYTRRLIGLLCFFQDKEEMADKCVFLIEKFAQTYWDKVSGILNEEKTEKIKRAVLTPIGAKGKLLYSDFLYEAPLSDIGARVSADSKFTVLERMYDQLNNCVWIKLRIDLSSQSYRYPDTAYAKNGDKGWIHIDTLPNISYTLNISMPMIDESADKNNSYKDIIYLEEQLKILLERIEKYRRPSYEPLGTPSGSISNLPHRGGGFPLARDEDFAGGQSASSSLNNPGGVDFSSLPIVTQQIKNLQSLVSSPLSINPNLDLDTEWARIQQIFNADIRPSVQRLAEFSVAVSSSPAENRRKEDVIGLIADLLRREEEDKKLTPADSALKGLLNALES